MDRHAAGCAACRDALRREMRIAAGVRRLGRESLKAELRARVATRAERTGWPRFASAAAVFLIVGGLGIYFGWLSGRGRVSPEPEGAPPIAGGSGGFQKEEKNTTTLADARSAGKPAALPPSVSDRAADQGGAVSGVSPAAVNAGRPADRDEGIAASRAESTLQSGAPGEGFWSDGIVEQGGDAAKKIEARGAVAGEEKEMMLYKSKSMKEEVERLKDAPLARQSRFIILQRSASALPARQKGRDMIPTRVDQKGDTTTMTLYLDSLVDESDLKRARVDAPGDDSIVVTLGGKKIQYRFPPPPATQQQRPK